MRRNFRNLLAVGTFLIGASLFAQEKTVTGTVKDQDGLPVADAVVKTSGGKEVYTDENGLFSVDANKGESIIIESFGLPSQTFIIGDQNNYSVSLKPSDDIELGEAVVTALGIKREKKSLGFASQEVKGDELSGGTTNTGNVASLLSGKVAGLNVTTTSNFGGSANLVIRGVKSLGGSNPLIVIDGSPVDNSVTRSGNVDFGNALSDINQEDIASINVLKGAAASALYGERGLNGVIVITTKSGKGKEDGSWGVTLTTSTQVGSIDKSTFPEYQNKYGSGYSSVFLRNGYVNYGDDGSWGPAFNPNLMVYKWDAFDPSSPNFGKQTPWTSAQNGPITYFNTPVTYTNSINLQKGDSKSNFNFGYTNMHSNGIEPNSKLNKNSFSFKVNHDLNDRLHATVYSTLTLQSTKGRNQTNYSNNTMSTFRQWWSVDVDIQDQKRAYFANRNSGRADLNYGNVTWNRRSAEDGRPLYMNNPYFQAYENYNSDDRARSFSYAQLTFDASENINITGKVSYDRTNVFIENRLAIGSLNQAFGLSGTNVGSGYQRQDITRSETNYDLLANYKFDLTADINVSGVVGANIRRNTFNSIANSTEGGLIVRDIYALSNSLGAVLPGRESVWTTQTNSAFATASIDFYKIFFLDATWRIDNSSTLPKNNNTFNYPSVTGALIMSEIIDASWMNFWKIRANYAEVGGTADPYLTASYYAPVGQFTGNGGLPLYNTVTSQPNSNLKPQRAKEFEVGTEFSLFNNRLTFDFAYYKTKTMNQILSLPISSASQFTTTNINAGQIDNWGYEVQLGVIPVRSADFSWNIDVNWGQNRNKVVKLYDGVTNYLLTSVQGGVSMNAREGEAWGTLTGSDYTYLNGQKVVNSSGNYVKNNNQIIGNAIPDWIGGVRNSFRYKNLSASFLIDVRHGGDVFSTDMWYGLGTGLYKETAIGSVREDGFVREGVKADGSPNTTPVAGYKSAGQLYGYGQAPNKAVIYDGSYIKLREASIGYSLPEKYLRSAFIKEAKVSLVGRNLWIIHKNLPYADPESMLGGGLNSYGFSIGSLPTVREIGLNVTFKF